MTSSTPAPCTLALSPRPADPAVLLGSGPVEGTHRLLPDTTVRLEVP